MAPMTKCSRHQACLARTIALCFRRFSICPRKNYERASKPPNCRSSTRGSPSPRSEEHTSELQSPCNLVCRLLLEKKHNQSQSIPITSNQYPSIPIKPKQSQSIQNNPNQSQSISINSNQSQSIPFIMKRRPPKPNHSQSTPIFRS